MADHLFRERAPASPLDPVATRSPAAPIAGPPVDGQTTVAPLGPSPEELVRMRGVAASIHAEVSALMWSDEGSILRGLRGRTPTELAALRQIYRQEFGGDLDAALADELDDDDLTTARYLMQGKPRHDADPAPEEPAAPDTAAPLDVDRAADALFRATDALNTDEDAIYQTLAGKTPAELASIRAAYEDHYGTSLDDVLRGELDEDEWVVASAHLEGDRVAGAAAEIVAATDRLGTDEEALRRALGACATAEDRERLSRELEGQGLSLDGILAAELEDEALDEMRALATGDRAAADAARLAAATSGLGTDEGAIAEVLGASRDDAERQQVLAAYQRRTGIALDAELEDELSDTEADELRALASGDRAGAAAAKLRSQIGFFGGLDAAAVVGALEGLSASERSAALAAYESTYDVDLQADSDDRVSATEAETIRQAAAHGSVDAAFDLHFSMAGAGTDEARLHDALKGLDAGEAAQTREAYEAMTGRALDGDLTGELSGRDEFYGLQEANGRAGSVDEEVERANAAWEFERGSGAGVLGGLTDVFYDAGTQLDRQHDRLADATDEAEKRRLLGFHEADVDSFHTAQDNVAQGAATTAQLAAAVAVTIATGGLGSGLAYAPLANAVGSAGAMVGMGSATAGLAAGSLAGGLASMGTKRLVGGESYGDEAAGADLGMTAASVAASFTPGLLTGLDKGIAGTMGSAAERVAGWGALGHRAAHALESRALQGIVSQGIYGTTGGLISGTGAALTDERTWRGGHGAENALGIMGISGLAGGVAGAASEVADVGFRGGRLRPAGVGRAFLEGTAGGLVGGTAQTLVTPGVLDGDGDDLLNRLLINAVPGAINQGLIQGARAWSLGGLPTPTIGIDDVGGAETAPRTPDEPLVKPGMSDADVQAALADAIGKRRDELMGTVDAALADPETRAVHRQAFEERLIRDLTTDAIGDVDGRLNGLRPDLDPALHPERAAERVELLRQMAMEQAAQQRADMSPEQVNGRLRDVLVGDAEGRAARELHASLQTSQRERNRAFNDEVYASGTSFEAEIDPITGQPKIGDDVRAHAEAELAASSPGAVKDFAVVGAGLPGAADYAMRQTIDGDGMVIADGLDLWGKVGEMPYGQNNETHHIEGLSVQPGVGATPGRLGRGSELALAGAATLEATGATVLDGKVIGVDRRPPGEAGEAWPEGATVRMRVRRQVPVETDGGAPRVRIEESYVYSKGQVDFATGMGSPNGFRGLPPEQIAALEGRTAANGFQLDAMNGRLMPAEAVLVNLERFRGGDRELVVPEALARYGAVVQAGGATSGRVSTELAKQGVDVTWLARESPPGSLAGPLSPYRGDPEIAAILAEVKTADAAYQKMTAAVRGHAESAIASGDRSNDFLAGTEDGAVLRAEGRELMARREELTQRALERLQTMEASATTTQDRLAAQRSITDTAAVGDPFAGAQLPGHYDSIGDPRIHKTTGDVMQIQPIGEDRVRIYLHDGRVIESSRMVTATGQNNPLPGLLQGTGPMSPIRGDGIGLPGEIFGAENGFVRSLGASAQSFRELASPMEEAAQRRAAGLDADPVLLERYDRRQSLVARGADASPAEKAELAAIEAEQSAGRKAVGDEVGSFYRARSYAIDDLGSRGVGIGLRAAVGDRVLGANMVHAQEQTKALPESGGAELDESFWPDWMRWGDEGPRKSF